MFQRRRPCLEDKKSTWSAVHIGRKLNQKKKRAEITNRETQLHAAIVKKKKKRKLLDGPKISFK
jgi:hypothetical protein